MPRLDEEAEQRQRDFVYTVLRPLVANVEEMTYAWRHARPLTIRDLKEYRLLSEYGKFVFAARDDGGRGLHFVTWEYSYDRTGVSHGHYGTDYAKVKMDFATRSGLFPEKMFFTEDEIRQMHAALLFQGKHDDDLLFEQEQELRGVIARLEYIDPHLKGTALPAQSHEPEPEQ